MGNISIKNLLQWGTEELEATSDSPQGDARILLSLAMDKPKTFSMTWPEHPVTPNESKLFQELIHSRRDKVPIAYLVGSKEFWSLDLQVSRDTLIPRPETELLVEKALEHIPDETGIQVVDLGTGSGAIALAIAKEKRRVAVHGTDSSANAMEIAEQNKQKLRLPNVTFHTVTQWFPAAPLQFDVVVSNPPYVADNHINLSTTEILHEPRSALVAGPEGLDAIEEIVALTPQRIKPGGWLLLEHGFDQREAVARQLQTHGFDNIVCYQDLAGIDRVTEARLIKPK